MSRRPSGRGEGVVGAEGQGRERGLTPLQRRVTQEAEAEPPFSGAYWNHDEPGLYVCVCCGRGLFEAAAKVPSGSGWPAFRRPAGADRVRLAPRETSRWGPKREALCAGCGAHLGDLYPEGAGEGPRRYCVNSAALDFRPAEGADGD